jgi:hypothetical protein
MLDPVRSFREAVAQMIALVEEAIHRVDGTHMPPPPAPSRRPMRGPERRPRSMRDSARLRSRRDAPLLARRQQIESRLPEAAPTQANLQRPQGEGTFNLPPRSADAPGGREFMRSIEHLSPAAREQAILAQVRSGNVPDFLRQARTVELEHDGHRAQVQVMPDYLAIGSNDDHVRIPMTQSTAEALAAETGSGLPTRTVVDATWQQADVRIDPRPLSRNRESVGTFAQHDSIIDSQLGQTNAAPGALVAGHKKDIVASDNHNRVAIYGWHEANGRPIQPLSTVHHRGYVDYSHGVRLMSDQMIVDGRPMTRAEVMADPNLRGLLAQGMVQ